MAEYKYVQELLSTDNGTEGSLLIPRKIHDTLIAEVEKFLIPRSEAAVYIGPGMIPGSSYDFNLFTKDSMKMRLIGEGSSIFTDTPAFSSVNIKPKKYGVNIVITGELLEDAKWNLLEQSIKYAAKKMAEKETELIISESLDSAANTISGGASFTIANLTRAMQYLEDSDYMPTTLFVGPEVLYDLRNIDTFVEADKLGSREMLQGGYVGTIYGLNVVRFSATAAPTTTYSKYAYVTDKNEAYAIVEKRPVRVEEYNLETHDLRGAAVTCRIATNELRTSAICKITTS